MPGDTSIGWTEKSWNPVTGCDKVSPGCAHCYAETFAERWCGTPGHPYEQGFDLKLWPERLDVPLRWRKPSMIFVNSMSDLFHEDIPDEYIARVFDTMRAAQWHMFQVLTKRPERMRDVCLRLRFSGSANDGHGAVWLADKIGNLDGYGLMGGLPGCSPLPNVWLGVSIENRRFVERADILRDTPAAVRFVSAKPLLGSLLPVDYSFPDGQPHAPWRAEWYDGYEGPGIDLTGIDWLIAGGESGPRHRSMDVQWVRDLRDACLATTDVCEWCDHGLAGGQPCTAPGCREGRVGGTAFFYKQAGGRTPKAGGRELDGRTWDEMPQTVARESVA